MEISLLVNLNSLAQCSRTKILVLEEKNPKNVLRALTCFSLIWERVNNLRQRFSDTLRKQNTERVIAQLWEPLLGKSGLCYRMNPMVKIQKCFQFLGPPVGSSSCPLTPHLLWHGHRLLSPPCVQFQWEGNPSTLPKIMLQVWAQPQQSMSTSVNTCQQLSLEKWHLDHNNFPCLSQWWV